MKPIIFLLILLVGGCVSKPVLFKDDEKKIKIHCNIYSDTLNTFENYYYGNNSLVDEHKVSFFLSSEEQQRIINVISENNFFELPDTIIRYKHEPNEKGEINVIFDSHDTHCEIEFEDKTKSVFMGSSHYFDSEESIRFQAIMSVITNIIERREDLKEFHQGIWTL
jgi:hypothetical protein